MRIPAEDTRTPLTPPRTAINMLSVSNCEITRQRLAPTASRTAISRCLAAPRASIRFATFAHAMNSTSATMTNKIRSGFLS